MLVWNEHARDFLDAVPDATLIVDGQGRIEFANAQAAQLFGYGPGELAGQPVELLVPERLRSAHAAHHQGYRKAPARRAMGEGRDLAARRRDGSEFPAQISLSPVQTDQGLLICTVVRDLTEHKQIERRLEQARQVAERDNRSKSAFLAAASHDLRQPLQTLTLLAAALARSVPKDSPVTEAIGIQSDALQTMRSLLDSLLDVGRVEAGVLKPQLADVPVQPIFDRLRREFLPQASAKDLALVIHRTGAAIHTDPALFQHVIQNLVANAIRYTSNGSVELRCSDESGGVRIDVVDTGVGIPEEERELIFQNYYQRPGPGQGGGHGLGLAIVRLLSGALGLTVSVQSAPGEGSVFSILAPRGPAAASG